MLATVKVSTHFITQKYFAKFFALNVLASCSTKQQPTGQHKSKHYPFAISFTDLLNKVTVNQTVLEYSLGF